MPTPRYKVLIVQTDSQELDFQAELGLDADKVYFTDVDFTADNVQDAIVEVQDIAAPLRVPIPLVYNGTVSNGDWIGYSNLLPGDSTPIVAPITGTFVGFTWSNSKSSADFELQFRLNSTSGTIFFTWSVDNTQNASVTLPTPEPVTAGQQLFIQYIDQGQNASDATLVLLFKS